MRWSRPIRVCRSAGSNDPVTAANLAPKGFENSLTSKRFGFRKDDLVIPSHFEGSLCEIFKVSWRDPSTVARDDEVGYNNVIFSRGRQKCWVDNSGRCPMPALRQLILNILSPCFAMIPSALIRL